jgi:hypothetical protein
MNTQLTPIAPHSLSTAQFVALSAIPPEAEWFANLRNRHTRENYQRDIRQFIAFAGLGSVDQLREVTRPHVLAWRPFRRQVRACADEGILSCTGYRAACMLRNEAGVAGRKTRVPSCAELAVRLYLAWMAFQTKREREMTPCRSQSEKSSSPRVTHSYML